MRKLVTSGLAAFCILYLGAWGVRAEGAFAEGHDGPRSWVGWSGNKQTKDEARSAAMQNCLEHGPHCDFKFAITSLCFAYARETINGTPGSRYTAASRPSEQQARTDALNGCMQQGARMCTVESFCDHIDEAAVLAAKRQQIAEEEREADERRAAAQRAAADAEREANARREAANAAAEQAERRRIAAEQAAARAEERARQQQITHEPPNVPQVPTLTALPSHYIAPNSYQALAGGLMFAGFLAWITGRVSRAVSGGHIGALRQIGVESASVVLSSAVLWHYGIVDEIKLLSIPLLGGFSVALISSMKFS